MRRRISLARFFVPPGPATPSSYSGERKERVMTLKNHLKRAMQSLSSVAFVLVCFVIASPVRAVAPAPDGGYPGFNTAEGQNALFNFTTGVGNTAVGWFSLWSDSDGSYNTAVGAGTLLFNVGNQSTSEGAQNTAIGTAALLNNTTGSFNMATGTFALFRTPPARATLPLGVMLSTLTPPAL